MPQYKIKSGDSLSKIAKSQGFTIKQLMAANPSLTDPNKIRAGANLKMPYSASKIGSTKTQGGANVGGSTKPSPYRGMTPTQVKALSKNKRAGAGGMDIAKTKKKTVDKPKSRPANFKKIVNRTKVKELYRTKSPSLGRRK